MKRCRAQIDAGLAALEKDRMERRSDYWFDDRIGHADTAVACMLRFIGEAHPRLMAAGDYPGLASHAKRLEALPAFQKISQSFIAPA